MKATIGLVMCLALFSATLFAREEKASWNFQPPQVISTVEPSYPANTVAGGTVILKVTVSSSGEIEDVRVLQEAKGFTQQAIDAVRKWKFEPAKLDGKPVTASIPVAFSFSQPIVWWNRQAK
jgi:TonB family protein